MSLPFRFSSTASHDVYCYWLSRLDHLNWLATNISKNSAQRFVPANDFSETLFQHRQHQISAQTIGSTNVVGGRTRLPPIKEPQSLLPERKRRCLPARP